MKSATMPPKLPPVHKVSRGNAWRVAACGLDIRRLRDAASLPLPGDATGRPQGDLQELPRGRPDRMDLLE